LPARELRIVLVALGLEIEHGDELLERATLAVKGTKELEHLDDFELVAELRLLELHADALAKFLIAPAPPGDVEQRHRSAVGSVQALEDLDRSSFSSAVRSEQTETFAADDVEIDAVYGRLLAVPLEERAAADCGGAQAANLTLKQRAEF